MSHKYPYMPPPSDTNRRPDPGPRRSSEPRRHASQDRDAHPSSQEPSSSSSRGGAPWSQDSALHILSSCGLEPGDLALLAELPEDVLTVDTLPHVLNQIKGKRGTLKPFSSSSSSHAPGSAHPPTPRGWDQLRTLPVRYPLGQATPTPLPSELQENWVNPGSSSSLSSSSSSFMVDFHHRPGPSEYGKTGRAGPGSSRERAGVHRSTHPSTRLSHVSASPSAPAPPQEYRPHPHRTRPKADASSVRNRWHPAASSPAPPASAPALTPSRKEALDFHGTPPQVFPYSCSLCDITVLSEKIWISHTNSSSHAEGQLNLLQRCPQWDCRLVSRCDSQSETRTVEESPAPPPQTANDTQKPRLKKPPQKKASDRSKVVCVKFAAQAVDETYLRNLTQPFGKIVKILMFPSLAFVELGSNDQAKDLVKFHVSSPLTVKGQKVEFSLSNTFNFLQSSKVISFSPAPKGDNGQSDLLSVVKRFGPPLYTLFLPSKAFVEMKNAADAQKLVDYYSSNSLRVNNHLITVCFSGEYNSLMRVTSARKYEEETPVSKRTRTRSRSPESEDKTDGKRTRRSRSRDGSRSREKRSGSRDETRSTNTSSRNRRSRSRSCGSKTRETKVEPEKPETQTRTDAGPGPVPDSRPEPEPAETQQSEEEEESEDESDIEGMEVIGEDDEDEDEDEEDKHCPAEDTETLSEEKEDMDTEKKEKDMDTEKEDMDTEKKEKDMDTEKKGKDMDTEKEKDMNTEKEDVDTEKKEKDMDTEKKEDVDTEKEKDMDTEKEEDVDTEKKEKDMDTEKKEDMDTEKEKDMDTEKKEDMDTEKEEDMDTEKKDMEEKSRSETRKTTETRPEDEEDTDFFLDLENCITLDELEDEEEIADEPESSSTRVVFFKNLPQRFYTDEDFVRLVDSLGTATRYFLLRRRGQGFIEMSTSSDAVKVVRDLNCTLFHGSRLDVNVSHKYNRLTNGFDVQLDSNQVNRSQSQGRGSTRSNEGTRESGSRKAPERESGSKKAPERESGSRKTPERESGSKKAPERESGSKKTPERESGSRKILSETTHPAEQNWTDGCPDNEKTSEDAVESEQESTKKDSRESPGPEEDQDSEKNPDPPQTEQEAAPVGGAAEPQKPSKPVGSKFVRPVVAYLCSLCDEIYADEDEAKLQHCSSLTHYRKYQEKTGLDPWTS